MSITRKELDAILGTVFLVSGQASVLVSAVYWYNLIFGIGMTTAVFSTAAFVLTARAFFSLTGSIVTLYTARLMSKKGVSAVKNSGTIAAMLLLSGLDSTQFIGILVLVGGIVGSIVSSRIDS